MKRVKIYHPELVSITGAHIGAGTKIHPFVVIQPGVRIGKNCKIEPFAFIPEGITIEDEVFIGPHVCFINDKYPRATSPDGSLKKSGDWKNLPTRVKKGASIGSNATLLCGITIGEYAMVGAGSVVTRDVPGYTVVVGNPARAIKTIDEPMGKRNRRKKGNSR